MIICYKQHEGPQPQSGACRAGMLTLAALAQVFGGCATGPMTPSEMAAAMGEKEQACRDMRAEVISRLAAASGGLDLNGCDATQDALDAVQGALDDSDACKPDERESLQGRLDAFRRDQMEPGCTGDRPADAKAAAARRATQCRHAIETANAYSGAAWAHADIGECSDAIEQFREAIRVLNTRGKACDGKRQEERLIVLREDYSARIAAQCGR